MIQELDHRSESTAKAIQKIQHPAYLVEAEMMGFQGIPQLKESILELRNSDEVFLGYMEKDRLLGFLSYKKESETIDIHRLVVDPGHFREGIGSRLLVFLLTKYQGLNFTVSTGKANVPAKKLYESHGFIEMEDFEVAPGIFCTALKKKTHH
ncbi:alanine acetyltransferase [Planococcus salinarum]|uniref:Alanine acetyltransferase n=1 Tax=Planococcus salinarum TaxID=622695 RepID=A0ABX3D097_9BACL|nr:GNAT family N-acetyltransferase [Planococcus salinarum]OHX51328.1 alanine acetyltransferase [Planococcus salinarum]TAA73580.1 GNAT family N-acetyltransferase [Planococcus salinarum]